MVLKALTSILLYVTIVKWFSQIKVLYQILLQCVISKCIPNHVLSDYRLSRENVFWNKPSPTATPLYLTSLPDAPDLHA